jgi:hypothetical protein
MKRFPDNSGEAELLRDLASELKSGELALVEDNEAVYRFMEKHFPMETGKVDWAKVPDNIEDDIYGLPLASDTDTSLQRQMREALVFFARMRDKFVLSDPVYFMNDGMDLVFIGTAAAMQAALPKMYWSNGHLYWFAADGSWCIQKSMTGYINFGFSPNLKT